MCDPKVMPTPTQTRLPVLLTPVPADQMTGPYPAPSPPAEVAADYA